MCDTVCTRFPDRTLFAKNSDRPVQEVQLIEAFPPRASEAGAPLRTQYLTIDDAPAAAMVGSRPAWLWGFEHGVNEHRVAVGNERVYTIDDPAAAPPALIGMDLVRLALERARTADAAVDTIAELLDRHGQGGTADATAGEAYHSSFLVADPHAAWIVETSGRTWVAEPVEAGAAISNRISLGTGWTRSSPDVAPGTDFDRWRDPDAWTAIGDVRLACTVPLVTGAQRARQPGDLAALLRHHGTRPWGRPGAQDAFEPVPPEQLGPDAEGLSVCMHVRGYQATAAAMICDLPADRAEPLRAWVAPGSPCASVFVPIFPDVGVPPALGRDETWHRFLALRERVEGAGGALGDVRAVLDPIEADLWADADDAGADRTRQQAFTRSAWDRVEAGLARLGV